MLLGAKASQKVEGDVKVGVDALYIIEVFEGIYQFEQSPRLICVGHFREVFGNPAEFVVLDGVAQLL